MNYQQKSTANIQNTGILYSLCCYCSLQDDGNVHSPSPQDDLIDEQEFIEENFNDDDFQTTC